MVFVHKYCPSGTLGIVFVHPDVGLTVPDDDPAYSIFVFVIPTPSLPAIPSVPLFPSYAL